MDLLVARRQITVQQALYARQQLQAALKTAGPEHARELGVFTREEAPARLRAGRGP